MAKLKRISPDAGAFDVILSGNHLGFMIVSPSENSISLTGMTALLRKSEVGFVPGRPGSSS